MSTTAKKTAHIQSIDPVWDAIVAGASEIVSREPSLSNMVVSAVLNHASFESALAHRLSERLHHSDVSADLIRQAMLEMLALYPQIGLDARADLAATYERDPACHRAIEPPAAGRRQGPLMSRQHVRQALPVVQFRCRRDVFETHAPPCFEVRIYRPDPVPATADLNAPAFCG